MLPDAPVPEALTSVHPETVRLCSRCGLPGEFRKGHRRCIALVGTMSDSDVALNGGITVQSVYKYRGATNASKFIDRTKTESLNG